MDEPTELARQAQQPDPSPAEPRPELAAFFDDGNNFEMNADTHERDAEDEDEDEDEDTSEDSRPAFLASLAQPDRPAGPDAAKTVVARPPKRRRASRVASKPQTPRPAHPQVGRVLQGESLLETPPPAKAVGAGPDQLFGHTAYDLDNSTAIPLPSGEFGRPPLELLDFDAHRRTAALRWLWPLLIALMVLVGSVGAYLLRTTGG